MTNNKKRESNFELLRNVAMFMILMLHANVWALGWPSAQELLYEKSGGAICRILMESISIVAVNVFVMISGWFGIRSSLKGFCKLVFQILYFFVGCLLILSLLGFEDFSFHSLMNCMRTTWFIRSYIGLYIIAPLLNAFLKSASKRQLEIVLISFYLFQTLYGWYWKTSYDFIQQGYSTFSFIGLYLLAYYAKNFMRNYHKYGGVLYVVCTLGTVLLCITNIGFGSVLDPISYASPFVLGGALGLILFTAKLKIGYFKVINWLGASSFAVFLLHGAPTIGEPIYKPLMQYLFNNFSGFICLLLMGGALICIYFMAILLDQPRKWIWNLLSSKFDKRVKAPDIV